MSAKQAISDKLQGSVATYLRCGWVVSNQIKKGLLLSLWVNFFKSVNIWQSYKEERGCLMHFARLADTLLEDGTRNCSLYFPQCIWKKFTSFCQVCTQKKIGPFFYLTGYIMYRIVSPIQTRRHSVRVFNSDAAAAAAAGGDDDDAVMTE